MFIDADKNVQLLEPAEKIRIKVGHSLRSERHVAFSAIARRYTQHVVYKIKINLKDSCAIGDWRRGEAPRRHIKRNMPGVVLPGSQR
jgi:hypothetical protein